MAVTDSRPFVVRHVDRVRFRDVDPRNHVNNAVFSTYLEQARLDWFEQTGDDDVVPMTHAIDMILGRTEIDFRSPLHYGETVEVGVRVGRVGTRSFDLEYELRAGGRVVAEAKSVLVGYDFDRGESAPIPEHWRRRIDLTT
jgi:acyl-CoA thioester hydrolase